MFRWVLLSVLLFWCGACQCQEFPMLHFTVDDGLPGNTVYQVYRDAKGFMWIATEKGIARYNGVKFETFTSFDGLADNEIFHFQEDPYGRLWMGTYNGELCYYKNDVFYTAANAPFLKIPPVSAHIRNITVEYDSSIIIRYEDPTKFLTIKNEYCKVYNLKSLQGLDESNKFILCKKINPDRYQLICDTRIIYIDSFANFLDVVNLDDSFYNIKERFTSCQDQHYMFNDRFLFGSDMKVVKVFPTNLNNFNYTYDVYRDSAHCFYTTNNGLIIDDSIQILNGDKISAVAQAVNGDYWINSLNDGVFVIDKDVLKRHLFTYEYTGRVKFAYADKNLLYFTTYDNALYELKDGRISCVFDYKRFKHLDHVGSIDMLFFIDKKGHYLNFFNNDLIYSQNLFAENANIKLIGSHGNGIKSFVEVGGEIYAQHIIHLSRLNCPISDLGRVKQIEFIPINRNEAERIFCMTGSPDQRLWYSTLNHVYRLENNLPVIQDQFKNITFKYFEFFGDYLVGYTHKNNLLVCTNFNGNVNVDSVPAQNCIWDKFYRLDSNHILISTNNLYRLLTLNINGAKKFSISIVENPYLTLNADAICSDGRYCYFFRNGELKKFDIAGLLRSPAPPELFFRQLRSSKQSYDISREVELSFNESRNITISFSALSFLSREILMQYSVSKNGDDNWRDVKGGEINMVNTGFGNYIVKIRAKTLSSSYCKPIAFALHISRPYWASWEFVVSLLGVTSLLVSLVIRRRIAIALLKKERAHAREIKFMKSEYKALNALMNPHFIFNTLNNVQSLVNGNDKMAANEYLRVFADLIRQNMQNISQEFITVQKEIHLVSNYLRLEKLRFEDKLEYYINIDDDIDLSDITIPPLLIQPLVENSIKHGILPLESVVGVLNINIYTKSEVLYIEVKDNGIGIKRSLEKKGVLSESYALDNIRKRISQLSMIQGKEIKLFVSDVNDADGKLLWTVVTISLPLL